MSSFLVLAIFASATTVFFLFVASTKLGKAWSVASAVLAASWMLTAAAGEAALPLTLLEDGALGADTSASIAASTALMYVV